MIKREQKYYCKSCGRVYKEEDKNVTKLTCAYCNKKMYKVKNDKRN